MNALHAVVTVKEAAQLFSVSHWTIRYHIDKGNIQSRKCLDGTWLIDLGSLKTYYKRLNSPKTPTH